MKLFSSDEDSGKVIGGGVLLAVIVFFKTCGDRIFHQSGKAIETLERKYKPSNLDNLPDKKTYELPDNKASQKSETDNPSPRDEIKEVVTDAIPDVIENGVEEIYTIDSSDTNNK